MKNTPKSRRPGMLTHSYTAVSEQAQPFQCTVSIYARCWTRRGRTSESAKCPGTSVPPVMTNRWRQCPPHRHQQEFACDGHLTRAAHRWRPHSENDHDRAHHEARTPRPHRPLPPRGISRRTRLPSERRTKTACRSLLCPRRRHRRRLWRQKSDCVQNRESRMIFETVLKLHCTDVKCRQWTRTISRKQNCSKVMPRFFEVTWLPQSHWPLSNIPHRHSLKKYREPNANV